MLSFNTWNGAPSVDHHQEKHQQALNPERNLAKNYWELLSNHEELLMYSWKWPPVYLSKWLNNHLTSGSPMAVGRIWPFNTLTSFTVTVIFDIELYFCTVSWKCLCPLHCLAECGVNRNTQICQMSNTVVTVFKMEVSSVQQATEVSAMAPMWAVTVA